MITDQNFDQITTFGRIAIVEENLSAVLDGYAPGRTVVLYVFFTATNSDEENLVFDLTKINTAVSAKQIQLINYMTGEQYTLSTNPEDTSSNFRVTKVSNKDIVNVIEIKSGSFEGRAVMAVSFKTNALPVVGTEFMSFSGFDSRAPISRTRG